MKNLKKKKVIVTGCAGFIGSHLCEKLIAKGYYVTGIDNLSTGRKKNIEFEKKKLLPPPLGGDSPEMGIRLKCLITAALSFEMGTRLKCLKCRSSRKECLRSFKGSFKTVL